MEPGHRGILQTYLAQRRKMRSGVCGALGRRNRIKPSCLSPTWSGLQSMPARVRSGLPSRSESLVADLVEHSAHGLHATRFTGLRSHSGVRLHAALGMFSGIHRAATKSSCPVAYALSLSCIGRRGVAHRDVQTAPSARLPSGGRVGRETEVPEVCGGETWVVSYPHHGSGPRLVLAASSTHENENPARAANSFAQEADMPRHATKPAGAWSPTDEISI